MNADNDQTGQGDQVPRAAENLLRALREHYSDNAYRNPVNLAHREWVVSVEERLQGLAGSHPRPLPLPPEEHAARAPLPPEVLADALQDRVHSDAGEARPASSVRFAGAARDATTAALERAGDALAAQQDAVPLPTFAAYAIERRVDLELHGEHLTLYDRDTGESVTVSVQAVREALQADWGGAEGGHGPSPVVAAAVNVQEGIERHERCGQPLKVNGRLRSCASCSTSWMVPDKRASLAQSAWVPGELEDRMADAQDAALKASLATVEARDSEIRKQAERIRELEAEVARLQSANEQARADVNAALDKAWSTTP